MVGGVPLILQLYVDGLFITRGEHLNDACKKDLASEFEMTDLGLMHYYLGMEVWQENMSILLPNLHPQIIMHQSKVCHLEL